MKVEFTQKPKAFSFLERSRPFLSDPAGNLVSRLSYHGIRAKIFGARAAGSETRFFYSKFQF